MSLIIPHQYAVDIANGTSRQKMLVPMVRGDGSAHQVTVTLLDRGSPAVTTGYTAVLYAVRAGDRVTVPNAGTIAGNVVTSLILANSLYVNGRVDLLLKLTKSGENELCPLWIEAECAGGVTDTYSDPENIIPSLSELLAQIQACEDATGAATAAADAIIGITMQATTLESGQPATATPSFDPEDGHLDVALGLPQGGKGDKGNPGASITGAAFNGNDIVFAKDDSTTVTLENAVPALTGPQGVKGDAGVMVYSGTAITGTSTTPTAYATGITLAYVGDRYHYNGTVDAQRGNVYKCTLGGDADTALWVYDGNIRGVAGSVSTVNGISPDGNGDVALDAEDIQTTGGTVQGDLDAKAAKAASPTAGHIATLDANGNPVDSTKSLSDLVTAQQGALKSDLTVVGATYSAASTYALGAFCTYNNLFYECTTAIVTPEAWTIGHWTERTVGYVLAALNTAKASKAASPTLDHISTLDAYGNPKDSGRTLAALTTQMMGSTQGVSIGAGLTKYVSTYYFPDGNAYVGYNFSIPGVISKLYVYSLSGAPGIGETYTMTFMKEGSAQAVTCQISGASSSSASDLTHTFSVNSGDRVTLRIVTSASAAASIFSFAFSFQPS